MIESSYADISTVLAEDTLVCRVSCIPTKSPFKLLKDKEQHAPLTSQLETARASPT